MRNLKLLLGAVMVAGTTACQDLTVENQNAPDRERATRQPVSAETFVASSFRTWWQVAGHDDYPSWALSTIAHEITSGFADFGQLELSTEPRIAWNNSPSNGRAAVSETPWQGLYRTISAVNDALAAIDEGLVIENASRTARTKAVGKFMQGISHGYLALYFDSAFVLDERVRLDTISDPQFSGYQDVAAAAIDQLDEAIAVAQGTSFTLPADNWFFTPLTSQQFVQLANSFAARIMVYSARTPAERAAVDWTEVLRRIDNGIKTDFAPMGQADILWDDWKRLVARVRTNPGDFGRPSYWVLGPADSTDGFVNWAATPVANRMPFRMVTKDRRIHPAGAPTQRGKYVTYNSQNIFQVARGTYRFSHYYFHRYGTGTSWQDSPLVDMPVAEMDLLKAEALIRLNRAAEAVPLINKTRVANGELPPVTVDGPPDEAGCVPRKLNGACGSLWDALRYEKKIEGMGVTGVIAYFDGRGWQALPEHSILHLPIPGNELAVLQRALYSYGGPGGEGSAPAPNMEQCPVALARCP